MRLRLPGVVHTFSPQPISHSRFGHNVAGLHRIRSQLAAQVAQGDAQQVHRVVVLRVPPDFVNNLVVRSNKPGVTYQNLQQIVFGLLSD